MNLLARFLRFFFHHLYHGLAFTYDFVAAVVSFGHWNDWTRAILPFVRGTRLLELGHGPGHLQRLFIEMGLLPAGLDESAPMGRLARARLDRAGQPVRLTRGVAQCLPFAAASFDCVVSTFPSEYIYDERTLAEVWRVLVAGGCLIVLPAVRPKNRILDWLFKVTGQSPAEALEMSKQKISAPFLHAGFETDVQILDVQSGMLMLVLATKREGRT